MAVLLVGCATTPVEPPAVSRSTACYTMTTLVMPWAWVTNVLWAPVDFTLDYDRTRQQFEGMVRPPCQGNP